MSDQVRNQNVGFLMTWLNYVEAAFEYANSKGNSRATVQADQRICFSLHRLLDSIIFVSISEFSWLWQSIVV